MLITQGVVSGFRREVSGIVTGVASQAQITDLRSFGSPEDHAINGTPAFIEEVKEVPGVSHVQRIASKMGVLKTDEDFLAIQLKGFGADYDSTFLRKSLLYGRLPGYNEIMLSASEAQTLRLDTGSRIFAYFFEDDIRTRRFTISGIYETHMPLFDKNMVFTNFQTIDTLNHWFEAQPDACTSLEIFIADNHSAAELQPRLQQIADKHTLGTARAIRIDEIYPQVFSWLDVLNVNMLLILILMVAVSGITMISGLLILILERTQTIGVLKALGATGRRIRRTFLYFAAMIVVRGMLLGNALGLGIILIQRHFGLIKLDPATYYVETVPVDILPLPFLIINIATLIITILALLLPSFVVSHIQPAKAIKFE